MILYLEPPEAWSVLMLVSAVAIDNADLSEEGKEAIRRWRSERGEASPELETLTEELSQALNAHIDEKLMRRVKNRGRYETVRK